MLGKLVGLIFRAILWIVRWMVRIILRVIALVAPRLLVILLSVSAISVIGLNLGFSKTAGRMADDWTERISNVGFPVTQSGHVFLIGVGYAIMVFGWLVIGVVLFLLFRMIFYK